MKVALLATALCYLILEAFAAPQHLDTELYFPNSNIFQGLGLSNFGSQPAASGMSHFAFPLHQHQKSAPSMPAKDHHAFHGFDFAASSPQLYALANNFDSGDFVFRRSDHEDDLSFEDDEETR